ncbi:MAG: hypothetical protein ACREYE_04245 [Gammaproteobacteria bacterium]
MSETIAITGKSVKLFKGHYTRGWGSTAVNGEGDRAHGGAGGGGLGGRLDRPSQGLSRPGGIAYDQIWSECRVSSGAKQACCGRRNAARRHVARESGSYSARTACRAAA